MATAVRCPSFHLSAGLPGGCAPPVNSPAAWDGCQLLECHWSLATGKDSLGVSMKHRVRKTYPGAGRSSSRASAQPRAGQLRILQPSFLPKATPSKCDLRQVISSFWLLACLSVICCPTPRMFFGLLLCSSTIMKVLLIYPC